MSDISTIGTPRRTRERRPNIKLPMMSEIVSGASIFGRDETRPHHPSRRSQ